MIYGIHIYISNAQCTSRYDSRNHSLTQECGSLVPLETQGRSLYNNVVIHIVNSRGKESIDFQS